MPLSPHTLIRARARPVSGRGGFTLFAAMLGLVAVGLAVYIGVTEVKKLKHAAQRDQFVEEVRGLATAFEAFRRQTGDWPAATHAELRLPRGMEAALAKTTWLAGPPFGGSYDWTPPPKVRPEDREAGKAPPPGLISVTAFSPGPTFTLSAEDLRIIDVELDDGNLATGRFRTGFNGWPVYRVSFSR